ncbi:BTB domain-containing protein [Mycena kentingensis (nom. inval.)]|nr:BTB domain-containing protein [Mycena kentingensis (nom. inval.)]KAF7329331.1 BTB domain-containing protein [Mycena kentingensis (nom. inval.)]
MSSNPDTPQRVPGLWFSDGNIVIQAGKSQYRVFHGILAARSEIFRDMLAIPQPERDVAELVDGCPLVQLPDDESDATAFLNAIYNPGSFPSFPNAVDINAVLGCLLLARKYEVDDIRRRALSHLSSGHPTTLSGTQRLAASDASLFEKCSYTRTASEPPPEMTLIRIISVARIVSADWILPYAFYRFASQSESITGAMVLLATSGSKSSPSSVETEVSCRGIDTMTHAIVSGVLNAFWDPIQVPNCADRFRCLEGRNRLASFAQHKMKKSVKVTDLAFFPSSLLDGPAVTASGVVCRQCADALKAARGVALAKFWTDLPGFFGLAEWAELEVMKAEAIGSNIYC